MSRNALVAVFLGLAPPLACTPQATGEFIGAVIVGVAAESVEGDLEGEIEGIGQAFDIRYVVVCDSCEVLYGISVVGGQSRHSEKAVHGEWSINLGMPADTTSSYDLYLHVRNTNSARPTVIYKQVIFVNELAIAALPVEQLNMSDPETIPTSYISATLEWRQGDWHYRRTGT